MHSRTFSRSQKQAALDIAGGLCQSCGIPITINNMHADHIVPWSSGGKTIIENCQALCPNCNLKKGSKMSLPRIKNKRGEPLNYRDWQKDALTKAIDRITSGRSSYFINVCPGGGKTPFGVALAKWAIDQGFIDKVVVVSPRAKIRDQWEDLMMLNGITCEQVTTQQAIGRTATGSMPKRGIAITYQLFHRPETVHYIRSICAKNRTMFIADEVHWLGLHPQSDTKWGAAFRNATEHARFVLPMSGTPFREDHYQLPFLQYAEGAGSPDYSYEYGKAVDKGDVTPVFFEDHTGVINFTARDHDGHVVEQSTMDFDEDDNGWYYLQNGELDEQRMNRRLVASLQNGSGFWRAIMDAAMDKLSMVRREHSNAGGIVFAMDQSHARAIAGYIAEKTGKNPRVIMSDESKDIDSFADSADPWVVSVRMINEGVDIERLRVAAMLTHFTTRKHFMQSVARCIRVDYLLSILAQGQWAYVFMPADPRFKKWAYEFRRAIQDQEIDPPSEGVGGEKSEKRIYEVDGSDAQLGGATFEEEYWTAEELAENAKEFERMIDPTRIEKLKARFGDAEFQYFASQVIAAQRSSN